MRMSVSIVTCNRAGKLFEVLDAMSKQDFDPNNFEVLVSDNGSTDNTKDVFQEFAEQIKNLYYLFDSRPGQLVGWHRALAEAKGEVTCFIDDDVVPNTEWLSALADTFRDPQVGMVTGPIKLPRSIHLPDWIEHMKLGEPGSQTLPFLSLLDFGGEIRQIPGNFVWGSNFSVRKNLLFEVGGFHPGAMPLELIHYYGDGEIFVGREVERKGYIIKYNPYAGVEHNVDPRRFALNSVYLKFMTAGFSRSFQTLRSLGEPFEMPSEDELFELSSRYFNQKNKVPHELFSSVKSGLKDGIKKHLDFFNSDPEFRNWVMCKDYLDLDSCYDNYELKKFNHHKNKGKDWRINGPNR